MAPQAFTMIVKEVHAYGSLQGIIGLSGPNHKKRQSEHKIMVNLTQSLRQIINEEKSEPKPTSGVFVCGLQIPLRFGPCNTHSRQMAQHQDHH